MRRHVILLAVIMGAVSAMFVLAPFMAPYGTFLGLDGDPCFIDHSWKLSEVPYLLGDILCHQEQDRSFWPLSLSWLPCPRGRQQHLL